MKNKGLIGDGIIKLKDVIKLFHISIADVPADQLLRIGIDKDYPSTIVYGDDSPVQYLDRTVKPDRCSPYTVIE